MGKHRKVRFDVMIVPDYGVSHWTLDRRQLPPLPPRCYHRVTFTNEETGVVKQVFDHRFVVN